jgi:hypothetical protein
MADAAGSRRVALEQVFRKPLEILPTEKRIIAAFRSAGCMFLNHWVSEQEATSYIGVGGGK